MERLHEMKNNTFEVNEQIHWTVARREREWNEYVRSTNRNEAMFIVCER